MTSTLADAADIGTQVKRQSRPTGFGYHLIYSSPEKYDEMVAWYKLLFGANAHAAPEGPSNSEVLDDSSDLVLIVKKSGLPQSSAPLKAGIMHVAWEYNSLAELMYVYRNARGKGVKADEALVLPYLLQIYFTDPDGNTVELSVDSFDTSEEAQEVLRGSANLRIPGKIDHWYRDLEMVLKMMEAGVSDQEIFDHDAYHSLAKSGRF